DIFRVGFYEHPQFVKGGNIGPERIHSVKNECGPDVPRWLELQAGFSPECIGGVANYFFIAEWHLAVEYAAVGLSCAHDNFTGRRDARQIHEDGDGGGTRAARSDGALFVDRRNGRVT